MLGRMALRSKLGVKAGKSFSPSKSDMMVSTVALKSKMFGSPERADINGTGPVGSVQEGRDFTDFQGWRYADREVSRQLMRKRLMQERADTVPDFTDPQAWDLDAKQRFLSEEITVDQLEKIKQEAADFTDFQAWSLQQDLTHTAEAARKAPFELNHVRDGLKLTKLEMTKFWNSYATLTTAVNAAPAGDSIMSTYDHNEATKADVARHTDSETMEIVANIRARSLADAAFGVRADEQATQRAERRAVRNREIMRNIHAKI